MEYDLTEWMTAGMQTGEPLRPERSDFITNAEGHLCIIVEHVMKDFWSVECLPAIINDSNEWEADYSKRPASAMLTIQDR